MKTTLILILTALSTLGAEILTTKRDAGVVSYPATTIVNSAIFETDGSGNVVMTPKSVYATSASLSSYLTTATASSTYAPISTTVTLAGTQTITGYKLFTTAEIPNAGTLTLSGGSTLNLISGSNLNIYDGTVFNYGATAQSAHRTALGLGALATSTDAANLTGNIARARIDNALSANAAPIVATTVTASGSILPTVTNVQSQGSSTLDWSTIWARTLRTNSGVLTFNDGNSAMLLQSGVLNLGTRSLTNVVNATLSGNLTASGTVTGTEQGSAPAAPAANGWTLYAADNGSGKTRLMIRFATGAAQQVAIEP